MKMVEIIVIVLFTIAVLSFGIVTAESETTYYILDNNGEWKVCTPSEAVYAQYYINKYMNLFPDKQSDRTWGPGLYDYDEITIPATTPTPILTPVPTPTPKLKPTLIPENQWISNTYYWKSVKDHTSPFKWLPR